MGIEDEEEQFALEMGHKRRPKISMASALEREVSVTWRWDKCLKLQIKSTPYKATVMRVGTEEQKKRNLIVSCLLALSLVAIGVVFGFCNLDLVHFGPDVNACAPDEAVAIYVDKYKNITMWDTLRVIGNQSVNVTESLNQEATTRYQSRYRRNG